MKRKNVKSIMRRGALYMGALFLLAVGMLLMFTHNSRQLLNQTIESEIQRELENFGARIGGRMGRMAGATQAVGQILADNPVKLQSVMQETLRSITESSEAYLSVFYTGDKNAVASSTALVELHQAAYMDLLHGEEDFFLYVEDDGITGEAAILYVCPVRDQEEQYGYLLSFMHGEIPAEEVQASSYDTRACFILANYEGRLQHAWGGGDLSHLSSEDVWGEIRTNAESKEEWAAFQRQLENKKSGSIHAVFNGKDRLVCTVPLAGTDWVMLMGLEEDYLKEIEGKIWMNNGRIQIAISAIMLAIFGGFLFYGFATGMHVSERKKELEDKADTDQLTGLSNKIATERKIKEYINENAGSQAVLVIVDVDNFKKINDTMGHSFGDEVLKELGRQLRTMFRVSDIVGRVGGDEFILFLKYIKEDTVIEAEGRKLEDFFHHFEVGEYVKYSVTASLGASVYPRDADSFEGLYKAADTALYKAKRRGKNQIAFYKEEE